MTICQNNLLIFAMNSNIALCHISNVSECDQTAQQCSAGSFMEAGATLIIPTNWNL